MPEPKNCYFHAQRGEKIIALRVTNDGKGLCGACYEAGEPWGHALEQKAPEAPAPVARSERAAAPAKGNKATAKSKHLDHAAMQRDRDSGMPVVEIAKRHDYSSAAVYMHTSAKDGMRIHNPAKATNHKRPVADLSVLEIARRELAYHKRMTAALERTIEILERIRDERLKVLER